MDSRVVALCYVLCAACAPEAGTARVVFTFAERPVLAVDGRPVDVTLTLAVEERTEAARRSLGSSSVSWPAGVTPESAEVPALSVPHGRARVVVMTLALVGGEVLYYGLSAPFDLDPGAIVDVPIVVEPRARPTLTVESPDAVDGRVSSPRVRLRVVSPGARVVELSNVTSFDGATTSSIPVDGLVRWDLDVGVPVGCGVEDACPRKVSVRTRDEHGVASRATELSLWVDTRPPEIQPGTYTVLMPAADPWLERVTALQRGRTATVSFAVSERLGAPPTLEAAGLVASPCTVEGLLVRCAVTARADAPAGDRVLRLRMADRVGHTSDVLLEALRVAPEPPAPPEQARVVLEVAPWGSLDLLGAPRAVVRGDAGAVPPGSIVVAFADQETRATPLGRTTSPAGEDGRFELRLPALGPEVAAVGLVVVDPAGQPSDASAASGVQAVLTSRGVMSVRVGSSGAPARLYRCPHRADTLAQPAAELLEVTERGTLAAADGAFLHVTSGAWWSRIERSVEQPEARYRASIAYDRAAGRWIMFGGAVAGTPRRDTWEYDGRRWRSHEPGVLEAWPGARTEAAQVFDAYRGGVLLIGGEDGASRALDDVWRWTGSAWSEAEALPAPRAAAAVAFDEARGEVVVFGGYVDSRQLAPGSTWVLGRGGWTPASVSQAPPPRARASMAFDPVSRQVILFGGQGAGGTLDDTWAWAGGTWTELARGQPRPPRRAGASLAFVPQLGQLVLIGGKDDYEGNLSGPAYDDAWTWTGTAWQSVGSHDRFRRMDAMLAEADASGTLLLLGGRRALVEGARGDVWRFDGRTWTPEEQTFAWPPPRRRAAAAFDPSSGLWWVGGGETSARLPIHDAWTWDGRVWRSAAALPNVIDPMLAWDEARGVMVLVGNATDLSRAVVFELVAEQWIEQPSARAAFLGAAASYSPDLGGVVVVGHSEDSVSAPETVTWRGASLGWGSTASPAAPEPRRFGALAWVPWASQLWLFGGLGVDGVAVSPDLALLDGAGWRSVRPSGAGPQDRTSMALVVEPRSSSVLAVPADTADLWVLTGTSPSWRARPLYGSSAGERAGASVGRAGEAVWSFGGGGATLVTDELWRLDDPGQPEPALLLRVVLPGVVAGAARTLQLQVVAEAGGAEREVEVWSVVARRWVAVGGSGGVYSVDAHSGLDAEGAAVFRLVGQGPGLDQVSVSVDYAL